MTGIALDGMIPMQAMLDLARHAERHGVPSLWMAEHVGYRDGVAGSMALLGATRAVTVAPTAISIFSRHPMIAAMTAATLEEFAPRRTLFALASGNPRALGELGLPVRQPLAHMREYVAVLRALWRGEPVTFQGRVFQLREARLHVVPETPPPLWIAAMGPRMLELTGEIADGVVLSAALAPAYIRHSLQSVRAGALRAGRDVKTIGTVGFVLASVGSDGAAARREAKKMLAYLFRNRFVAESLEMAGSRIDRPAVADAAARGDWTAALRGIPDEEVTRYAVAGTPGECRDQLDAFRDAGLDTPVLLAIGDLAARRLAVELAGARA
jgi:5,10-methylenetetrahydromethanopterin reductase